ncbi:MAG: hypothetical protein ACTSYR_06180, partial [Candidatus Odinarchaeia archaeon]
MKNKKITFILGSPVPNTGAIWSRISYIIDYLNQKGFSTDIIGITTLRKLNKMGFHYWKKNRIYNIIPFFPKANFLSSLINIFITPLFLFFKILYLKPKLGIVSIPSGEITLGAYLCLRLIGAKTILDYRDMWEDHH